MPFQPLQIQPANRIDSSFDFYTPLAELGKQWAKNREEEEAAKLVANLFGQQQQQNAAAQQAAVQPPQAAPPQAAPPQAAPPQAAPSGPLPPLQPSPISPPRGLTRTADEAQMAPGQRLAASHEAVTQDPTQRIEGGFEDLRRVIVDTPQPAPTRGLAPEQPAAADPMARSAAAISAIESGSKGGNYQELGPITKTGDRAYGRYQVMGANIPGWTEKHYGQRLTPQQFVANPAAQDAVFNGQFGEYTQKYGPTGAAKAWFAGERGMNNPNARDILGTSVSSYADKFNRGMGGLPPEITSGTSKPQAPEGLSSTQVAAFDKVVGNLASPRAPAGAASGISSAQIAQLYRNPLTRPIATAYLQKALDPGKYEFMVAGENVIRYNKADGSYSEIPLRQKPIVVGEDAKVFDPNTKTYIGGTGGISDKERYGKPGPSEVWVDPNDKSKGFRPVKGSEKEKIDADAAGRIGLGKSYLEEVGDINRRIAGGELGIENTRNHLLGLGGLGKPGELRRKIDSGADALIRMLTGAGKPLEEARDYARRYQLTKLDTQESLLSKTKQLTRELTYVGSEIGKGRGGFRLEGNALLTEDGKLVRDLDIASPSKATARTQDDEARDWVRQNPNDPRAAAIKRRLGM